MRVFRVVTVVLLLLAGACSAAFATDIFVATNGNDTTGNGSIGNPYATLTKATSVAVAGDTIQVRAGSYVQGLYWDTGGNGAPGAYITIQAYDGDLTASFVGASGTTNTIDLENRQYCKVIGLDVAATQSQGYYCVKLSGCQYVELKRCSIHDSGAGDAVKGNQGDYYLIEDNEIYRPGGAAPSGNNQGIDSGVDVDYATYRNNYIHDFPDMAFYCKGGSDGCVAEGNIVYDQDPAWPGPAVGFGQSTDQKSMKPGAVYQSYNMVMRNNLFIDCPGGAVGTYSCYHGHMYNNTIRNCGTASANLGIICQRATGDNWTPNTDGFYVYNNVFLDTRGQMPSVYRYHSGNYSDWLHDYNSFYNNGNPIPTGTWAGFDPNLEANSTFGNPNLANQTGTATTYAGWKNCLRITSASTLLIDEGTSAAGNDPQPAVHTDMDGLSRPQGSGWDIGAFEYSSAPAPPIANFTGNPTSGAVPLTVAFTDTSFGSPTSWSWTFGDGGASTAQSPSHVYTSANSYTVSLTATNAQGSDNETKTNYITAYTPTPPTFVAAGAVASGTGTITPALPSGIATNDILLLFLETANQAISISNQNGGTWTEVTNSPQGIGTAGGSAATRLTVFWSRYNGTQGAPTAGDSGNHQAGRIIAIRGCATSGNPWDVTAGGVEGTADTSGSIPGATTTVANTLVVAAIATSLPDANGTANFSAWANSDLTNVTERMDNTRNAGNGGGLAVATGEKVTAGVYGATAVTCGTAAAKGMLSIALKP